MSTRAATPKYRLDPHARFRVMDDEGIFVLQKAGEVLVVNRVGAFIVAQLEVPRGLNDLTDAITARFEVDSDRARADANSLLEALLEAGAISEA